MNPSELKNKLDVLLKLTIENEVVEFKKAENNYDFNKIGAP